MCLQHLYQDPKGHLGGKMILHYGDLIDGNCLVKIISEVRPTEVYNLAAQSHVKVRRCSHVLGFALAPI